MKEITDGKSNAAGSQKFKHQQWAKRYVDGDSLLEIARGADIPPCTLLRIVLPQLTTLDKYIFAVAFECFAVAFECSAVAFECSAVAIECFAVAVLLLFCWN